MVDPGGRQPVVSRHRKFHPPEYAWVSVILKAPCTKPKKSKRNTTIQQVGDCALHRY